MIGKRNKMSNEGDDLTIAVARETSAEFALRKAMEDAINAKIWRISAECKLAQERGATEKQLKPYRDQIMWLGRNRDQLSAFINPLLDTSLRRRILGF